MSNEIVIDNNLYLEHKKVIYTDTTGLSKMHIGKLFTFFSLTINYCLSVKIHNLCSMHLKIQNVWS